MKLNGKVVDAIWFGLTVLAVIACASMLGSMVYAAEVTLEWTPPTENVDGSPLTDLDGYNIFVGTSPGQRARVIEVMDETATSFVIPDLDADTTYFFAMKAYTVSGLASDYSNEVSKTTAADAPSPPNPPELRVSEDTTAYTIMQSRDRIALVAVGEIAPGTECDPAQRVLDKFLVPVSAVTWAGNVRSEVVLAACQ